MKYKVLGLLAALSLLVPAHLTGQTVEVTGGRLESGVLHIIPDTIQAPPETVTVEIPVEVCPDGWTCTPPPEPTGPFIARSNTATLTDTIALGSAAVGETIYVFLADATVQGSVGIYVNGTLVNSERTAPYTLGGDNAGVLNGWRVPNTLSGPVSLEFRQSPGESYTGILNVTGYEPPDPPTDPDPPDTIPTVPLDPDSLAIARMMGFAQGEQPYEWERLADYDSVFLRYSDQFWERFVADRDTATRADPFIFYTYYDRMMSHYEYWWRTGNEEMAVRGDSYLETIRDWYWVPNGYIQPRRIFPEGLLVHYYRTGDPVSITTYNKLTTALTNVWWRQLTSTQWLDGRVQGRTILGEIYRDPDKGRAGVDSLLAWYDRQPLGPGKWSMTSYCGGQAHFQAFHAVLYAMERYNDYVSTDRYDQIFPVIKATADTLWTMRNADTLFPYVSWTLNTEGSCGGEIANDLNGLLMPAFAWLYRETKDPVYRDRALAILNAMLDHTYWIGSGGKQWNQSYWQSQRALYWLKDDGP